MKICARCGKAPRRNGRLLPLKRDAKGTLLCRTCRRPRIKQR